MDILEKIYVLYYRTDRRIKWKYATYGGRYKTIEDALITAKERNGSVPFQYQIENMATEDIVSGYVNWDKRRIRA